MAMMKRYPLRLDEVSMKKPKYIAARNERSVNGEIANIIHVYIASLKKIWQHRTAGGKQGIGPLSGLGAKGHTRIFCHEKEKRSKAGFAP